MSEVHPLRISSEQKSALEAVDPSFADEKLVWARDQSWKVLHAIRESVEPGMTEIDARELAMRKFKDAGVDIHWHRPYVRLGIGTTKTYMDEDVTDYRIKEGDLFYLDLGPVWNDGSLKYEGDVGDTFVLGSGTDASQEIVQVVRDLFTEGTEVWKDKSVTGSALQQHLESRCKEKGYEFNSAVSGHRLSDFPHHKYSKVRMSDLDFVPSNRLWILELHIRHPKLEQGAFFEDLLSR